MSFQSQGASTLDYQPVSYPGSTLRFRGPPNDVTAPHILCLGGAETFGRFIARPYPALLAECADLPVTNMAVTGAGLDVAMLDHAIKAATVTATSIILQITGAQGLSNRYYTVHPRRNDRFVKASEGLRDIFPEVDFTEFHFTRHMLDHLKALSAERFEILREELQSAWQMRMLRFLSEARVKVHLLWLGRRGPQVPEPEVGLGGEPLFVTSEMLDRVAEEAASLSIVEPETDTDDLAASGMIFATGEAAAARKLPGPRAHEAACEMLKARLAKTD